MALLCKIGIHSWEKIETSEERKNENPYDYCSVTYFTEIFECRRCGRRKEESFSKKTWHDWIVIDTHKEVDHVEDDRYYDVGDKRVHYKITETRRCTKCGYEGSSSYTKHVDVSW